MIDSENSDLHMASLAEMSRENTGVGGKKIPHKEDMLAFGVTPKMFTPSFWLLHEIRGTWRMIGAWGMVHDEFAQ